MDEDNPFSSSILNGLSGLLPASFSAISCLLSSSACTSFGSSTTNLLKKSETVKEKSYHILVYLVKIAVTMAFCFLFVTIFSILFGNENSIVGVVVLLCLMVFRNADLGIHTGQSTMLLALFFVIMTVCPHLANQFSPVLGMLLNIAALAVLILFCNAKDNRYA